MALSQFLNTFAGNPLDRAGDRREDPAWLDAQLERPDGSCLALWEGGVLVEQGPEGARLAWLRPDMARDIAGKSPIAMKLAKHGLNTIEEMSLRDGYRFEQEMTAQLGLTEDSREAMRAFMEKRKPVFQGR